jgi:hypothetical protein
MVSPKCVGTFLLLQSRLNGLAETGSALKKTLARALRGVRPVERRGRVGWQEVCAYLHFLGPKVAPDAVEKMLDAVRRDHTANWLAQYEVEQRFKRGEITAEHRDKYFQTLDLAKKIGE